MQQKRQEGINGCVAAMRRDRHQRRRRKGKERKGDTARCVACGKKGEN